MLEELLLKFATGEALPDALPADPMPLFTRWFDDAVRDRKSSMPDAMALATVNADGAPSVRYVLCKKIEPAGAVHFFTNLNSPKARELDGKPRASAAFYWDDRARQVRLDGTSERLTDAENDAYFATRPFASKIGAWASKQSEALPSREQFARDIIEACKKLKIDPAALMQETSPLQVPRPEFWGGYRLKIERLELWCGASGRLHDRARWIRSDSSWRATRLYP